MQAVLPQVAVVEQFGTASQYPDSAMGDDVSYFDWFDEYELLNFFGTLPQKKNSNEWVYEATDAHAQLCFALAPWDKDVAVLLRTGEFLLYELHATVQGIVYHQEKGSEWLELIISERESTWLRTKPRISVSDFRYAAGGPRPGK